MHQYRSVSFTFTLYNYNSFKLSNIDWVTFFSGCFNANQFASKFTDLLTMETDICTRYVPAFRRQRLPRHIVHLLRAKKRAWSTCKHTGDRATFKAASKVTRAALRQHRRCNEMRIIYANNRRSFFKHIRNSFGSQTSSINLCINDTVLTDQEAAETLLRTLLSNFSAADNRLINNATSSDTPPLRFNCTAAMVASALQQCSNSSCSSDGISFRLLKAIGGCILFPLNIIYQHSLFEGTFPTAWKHAVVIPLYKKKGLRSSPDNYRPISLWQCLGKLLERIIYAQLAAYVKDNDLLCHK